MNPTRCFTTVALSVAFLAGAGQAPMAQQPADHVAAIKKNLADSQVQLRLYEWIETTVISHKGEEKSRQQNRCYYGADGKVQEVPVTAAPEAKDKRGVRGRIADNKKEEIGDYMKQAVALVKSYVPPSPDKIQKCKDAGKMSITPGPTGVRVDFKDYLKPGDVLTVEMDPAGSRLLAIKVASYIDDQKDAVNLDVQLGALTDGSTYASQIALDAKAKEMAVAITNSGYRKTGA